MITAGKIHLKRHSARLTDYRKRYRLLRSRKPRLVIRKTNRQLIMQLVQYAETGDRVKKTWLSKSVGGGKNYNSLLALYDFVAPNLPEGFLIDTGLVNNSVNLAKLFTRINGV